MINNYYTCTTVIHVIIIVIIIYVITNIIFELYIDNNESSLTKVFYKHTHEIIIVYSSLS